jgi:hypothetical protein
LAAETRALLASRGVSGAACAVEPHLSATRVGLDSRLLRRKPLRSPLKYNADPRQASPLLAQHNVSSVSPAAADALTQAVVNRVTELLDSLRSAYEYRAPGAATAAQRGVVSGQGAFAGLSALPRPVLKGHDGEDTRETWLVPRPASVQRRVYELNSKAELRREQEKAAQRAAELARAEAEEKKRKAASSAEPSEEDKQRTARLLKLRAEEDARRANAASNAAAQQAMGAAGAVAIGTQARWAAMVAAGGDVSSAPAAAPAAPEAAAAAARAMPVKPLGLRDVVLALKQDPKATPRLLAVACERLRRAEGGSGAQPPWEGLLTPYEPKWL